jgi:hypothetical protein
MSNIIRITYVDDWQVPQFICLPEVPACEVSSRFRDLCELKTTRVSTIDEVLGQSRADFERNIYGCYYIDTCNRLWRVRFYLLKFAVKVLHNLLLWELIFQQ